jgi:hypothetical protein
MKLTYFDADNVLNICTLAEAVEREIDARLEDTGQIETNSENITASAQFFGRLLTVMHREGLLSEETILYDILQEGYEKVP